MFCFEFKEKEILSIGKVLASTLPSSPGCRWVSVKISTFTTGGAACLHSHFVHAFVTWPEKKELANNESHLKMKRSTTLTVGDVSSSREF